MAAAERLPDRWNHVPEELRGLDQWVIWRWETRDGKRTKAPYNAGAPTLRASSTDPDTWRSFDQAVRCATETPAVAGIGFVFGPDDPFCGVDFDHALRPDGEVEGWALDWLRELGGYQEISPSGTGVKVIVRASVKRGRKTTGKGTEGKGGLEVYSSARFFTITGDSYNECMGIPDRQGVINRLVANEFPKQGSTTPKPGNAKPIILNLIGNDEELIDRARAASNGHTFIGLYDRGDTSGHGDDDSSADLALCNMLAFWTGGNPDQMDRLFRRSALMRPKWDEHRGQWTYGQRTIDRALSGRSDFYAPDYSSPHNNHKSHKNAEGDTTSGDEDPIFVGSVVNVGGFLFHEEEWSEPRLSGPDPAEPFPLDVLPERLRRFCEESAASIQCPVDFIACQVVILAGGVIGQSVNLEVKPHYHESTNLYLALVGAPGEKKSPPIKLVSRALWRIDADLRDEYRQAKQEYEIRLQEWTQDKRNPNRGFPPTQPIHRQLTLDDATREAVALIHSQNLRGLVLIKPELVGWVKALNTFKGGKGDDRQFWLSVNSNETVKVSRKGTSATGPGEPIIVPNPCVTIVGGLQPDILPEFRESKHDDGWIDRILFSFPDPVEADEWSDDVIADEALQDWEDVVARLFKRDMIADIYNGRPRPVNVRFTEQARELWRSCIKSHRAEKKDPEFSPGLRGPWAKLEAYAARLSLILSQINQACAGDMDAPPADVDAFDVHNAWRLIGYFKSHFRRARSLLIRKPNTGFEEGMAILRWIERSLADDSTTMGRKLAEQGDRKFFSRRDVDVQFNWWDDEDQSAGLGWLIRRRLIRPGHRDESARHRGRPASQAYEISPVWIRTTIPTNPTKIDSAVSHQEV